MHVYRVFGGGLRSELRIPELEAVDPAGDGVPADWELTCGRPEEGPGPARPGGPDGTAGPEGPGVAADAGRDGNPSPRLLREGDGVRVDYGPWGSFRISGDGAEIRWISRNGGCPPSVRRDVRLRVLPAALFQQGLLTLHASAVAADDGVIAFVGGKGFGKSALAARFAASGGRVVADDLLPVDPDAGGRTRPEGDRLRLRPDVVEATGLRNGHPADADGRMEVVLDGEGEADGRADGPLALAAVYLLTPVPRDPSSAPVRRIRLSGRAPAKALRNQVPLPRPTGNGSGGGVPGGPLEAELLARCRALAERVPVYRLDVVRDLERLGEVEAALRELHGGADGGAAG